MPDIAQLGFAVDSAPLQRGEAALEGLATAAGRAEVATENFNRAQGHSAQTGDAQTAAQRAATAAMHTAATATGQATAATKSLTAAQKASATSSAAAGLSARQHAAAMRMLPAQITDIVTSLISGQPAYLVAIQQGGQLKDSFGGIGSASRALVAALNPMTLLFTGIAAAVGTVAYGFVKGEAESTALARSLAITGDVAGVTAGQLSVMAEAVGDVAGGQAKAAATIAALASTGRVAGDQLEQLATIAVQSERVLGLAVEDTVKAFAELGKDPVRASMKLNDTTHHLTLSIFEQIQALERQGRTVDAAKLAQQAYADALASRAGDMEKNLGTVERSWLAIRDAIVGAKNAILDIGRVNTTEQQLAALQQRRQDQGRRLGEGAYSTDIFGNMTFLNASNFAWADAEERRLQAIVDRTKAEAAAGAEEQRRHDAAVVALDAINKARDASLSKQEQLNKALREFDENVRRVEAAGGTVADKGTIRASIIEKILGKNPEKAVSMLQAQISAIESALAASVQAFDHAGAELEQKRAAGLVSESEYYRQRIANIQGTTEAQVRALEAENAIIAAEQANGQKRIDNQTKIAENVAKMAMIQADARAEARLLGNEQEIAGDRAKRAFQQAKEAADAYLASLERTYQRDIDDFGKGPAARRRSNGLQRIDDREIDQLLELQSKRTSGAVDASQFQQQRDLIMDTAMQARLSWLTAFDEIESRSRDFGTGLSDAFASYGDQISRVGLNLGQNLVGALDQAKVATSQLAAEALLWGEGGTEAAKQIARTVLTETAASFIQAGIEAAAMYALQKAGIISTAAVAQTATTTTATTQVAANAEIAASAAPAAGLTSLASFGANAVAALAGITAVMFLMKSFTKGFRGGGYTGAGPVDQAAGVVHRREFVFDAPATARIGIANLEQLRRGAMPDWMAYAQRVGMRGYQAGGYVTPQLTPSRYAPFPSGQAGAAAPVVNIIAEPGTVVVRQDDGSLITRLAPALLELVDIDQAGKARSGRGRAIQAQAERLGVQQRAVRA